MSITSCAARRNFRQTLEASKFALNEVGTPYSAGKSWPTTLCKRQIILDIAPAGIRVHLTTTKLSTQRSRRTFVPRRFTGLERDSGNIGLHSNATRGGRTSQGQRRQGLLEEVLWQAAEEASRRYDRQDLLRMRQAGIPRKGLLEPTGVV